MKEFNQKNLFFIIAPDRSGTSLTQELMNTFNGFCNKRESRIAGPDSPSCWEYVNRYNDFSYLENFIEDNWTKQYFVEKSPPSITCIPQISKRYPNANFILLKRNPFKILLSQLNLFSGISEIGTRKSDLGNLLSKNGSIVRKRERIMAKRLLKMIKDQIRYKSTLKNHLELKYEDIVGNLNSQINLIEKHFDINGNFEKAQKQIKTPAYSSTFRYGLKELSDKVASDIIKLTCKLWGY